MATIKYPASMVNDVERYAYLYRLQELLRLEHNEKGKAFRENKLTEADWNSYKNDNFEPKSQLISEEILHYRELVKKNNSWDSKELNSVFE